tara:strand:+ start:10529 stop:11236 length:708 start_codon:yes stop_codon:yes gene_type:complete
MKVVILAGGKGSRISQYTQKIPKPMIRVGNVPMLTHIMRFFKFYGFNEFIIAGGYKINIIKKYYKNSEEFKNLEIIFTGENSMTGGRVLKLKKYLKNEDCFFMTYGDGITNINLKKLLNFHQKNNKIATVTAVRPPVKFGELDIDKKSIVKSFIEKPQVEKGWINGGFFILNKEIFNYIKGPSTIFELEPLSKLSKKEQLIAYRHKGYWRCMDNLNEKKQLEKIYKENKSIWNIK